MFQMNTQGFDISYVSMKEWIFHVKNGEVFVGSFRDVALHAVLRYKFDINEISIAVDEMLKKDHNSAHFGSFSRFIYTFNREEKRVA